MTIASLDSIYSRVSRRIVPLMLLGYIAAYLDRVNVGFAKLQMLDDLRFSQTVYGFGAGIFFIGYFLFEVPSNMILHRVGARRWLARIMISWGIISAAMMFVDDAHELLCAALPAGRAEAGFFPGVIYYLTQWYPGRAARARSWRIFMTGVAICERHRQPPVGMDHGRPSLARMDSPGGNGCFCSRPSPAVLARVLSLSSSGEQHRERHLALILRESAAGRRLCAGRSSLAPPAATATPFGTRASGLPA